MEVSGKRSYIQPIGARHVFRNEIAEEFPYFSSLYFVEKYSCTIKVHSFHLFFVNMMMKQEQNDGVNIVA